MPPAFFRKPSELRTWLARHGSTATELVVGFYKVGSGEPSITWPQAVDEALCVGWIDGVRNRIDEHSYQIRFTPRKATSTWSAVNISRVEVLTEEGRMKPAGQAAFARRSEARSRTASYEQKEMPALTSAVERRFRSRRKAWEFFAGQSESYRRKLLWWIVSAKQPATQERRLAQLIEASEMGRKL